MRAVVGSDGRRRLRLAVASALAVAAATLLSTAGSAAAAQPLRVALGGGASFPVQSLVLSTPPGPSLGASQVHVAENGAPVASVTVNPIRLAPVGDFGVVLALDSGPSMRGVAIDQAMAAARAIAAQRTAAQELGLVLFAQAPTIKLPLTQDPQAIQQALAQPPVLGGITKRPTAAGAKATHIYDGVQLALQQLQAAHIASGAVIVLSNGADQGSQGTLQSIASVAGSNHIRIFTVGLRNSFFRPQTLAALARIGGGTFTEADPSQLSKIFTGIETGLTSKYVIHYRSLQPLGSPIQVSVSVDGVPGTSSVRYTSPPAPVQVTRSAREPASIAFWTSTLAIVLAACLGGLMLALAVTVVLIPFARRTGVRARVGEFISGPIRAVKKPPAGALETSAPGPTERALERLGWWRQFKEDVEIARIDRPAIEIIYLTALGTIVTSAVVYVLVRSPLVIVPVAICGPIVMRGVVNQRLTAQRRLFSDQLAAHLQEIAAAMRSGHSIVGAIRAMTEGASEPTSGEFRRALADEELGMPLEQALAPIVRRMQSDDVDQVALVISLHRHAGGNMAEVLDRLSEGVRQRAELRRELRSLTAQARLSRWIVTALPVVILLFISITSSTYVRPLFHTTGGVVLLVVAAAMVALGSLVMRAIVNIEP